ncbi:MAG: aminoacyl-tRNA hydrolase, partial [Ignavibacteriaceae bacterium]|nr:aminoacyl-tRNA hydrolase [Ignavibacteriaceae bacterium]
LLDLYAQKNSLHFTASKNDYFFAEGKTAQSGFSLIKPSTFVNNSGIAALQAITEYNTPVEDFLVIADDINLETGKVRIRIGGGDGGHNGINSIIYHLNSDEFPRLRIGIGNNFGKGEMADYVLSSFSNDEFTIISTAFNEAVQLIDQFIQGGIKQMLDANSKPTKL